MADYAESINKPASELISLVLTDIEMPEMDGYILTKKIKERSAFCRRSGHHALVAVRNVEPAARQVGRCRRVRRQVRATKLSEALARRILGETASLAVPA